MTTRIAKRVALAAVVTIAAWAVWSYVSGGLLHVLLTDPPPGAGRLETLRTYVQGWGVLAPLIYVGAVIAEVLIAPIPGLLLYAPSGAIFGGFLGGTLSLAGNVIGAVVACFIARLFGARIAHFFDEKGLVSYRDRLVARGGWIIFLLRVNPLTSSDLVSYAAGFVGVSPWKVAAGTLAGMAPLCYAQSYLAEQLFDVLPGSMWIVIVLGAAYAAFVIWILARGARSLRAKDRA